MSANWSQDIRHYRKEADTMQAQIDHLSDAVRLEHECAALVKRRDLWTRLADELEEYRQDTADDGLFDEETP